MTEDPTRRINTRHNSRTGYAADAPTTAMPGPLNLARSADGDAADSSTTDVLSLDELFDGQPPADTAPTAPRPASTAGSETAPTWTALPVVPVRSEPMTPAPAAPRPTPESPQPAQPPIGGRMRTDAAGAWDDTVRRTRGWLGRDDNALMLLTALVAVALILAVTALSA
jgi:hypothetical protein